MDLSKFYVVAVISNPIRSKVRVNLFEKFQKHLNRFGAKLVVVELAYGDRDFSIAKELYQEPRCQCPTNVSMIQLKTYEELWHKENLINIGISRLPSDWEYVAWIDADIEFRREDWLEETWHQLQHHYYVQMFSQCIDLGPKQEIVQIHDGFMYMYWKNGLRPPQGAGHGGYYGYDMKGKFWHSGYAHAARREAIDYLGGLMEFPICGSADHHMCLALIGEGHRSLPGGVTKEYRDMIMQWQDRALRYLQKDVGYVDGLITHDFHGPKASRQYISRWDILTKNKYNPHTDLKKDSQGVLQLVIESERQIRLRDELRLYFRSRDDDKNTL